MDLFEKLNDFYFAKKEDKVDLNQCCNKQNIIKDIDTCENICTNCGTIDSEDTVINEYNENNKICNTLDISSYSSVIQGGKKELKLTHLFNRSNTHKAISRTCDDLNEIFEKYSLNSDYLPKCKTLYNQNIDIHLRGDRKQRVLFAIIYKIFNRLDGITKDIFCNMVKIDTTFLNKGLNDFNKLTKNKEQIKEGSETKIGHYLIDNIAKNLNNLNALNIEVIHLLFERLIRINDVMAITNNIQIKIQVISIFVLFYKISKKEYNLPHLVKLGNTNIVSIRKLNHKIENVKQLILTGLV